MAMNYFIIIFAIVFFVVVLPLRLKFQGFYSMKERKVFYSIMLFKIPLYSGYLFRENGELMNADKRGKIGKVDLSGVDFRDNPLQNTGITLLKFADFQKLNIFVEVGADGDAFVPIMLSGAIRALLGVFHAYISTTKRHIDVNEYVVTKTDKEVFEAAFEGIFWVSILIIVYSILKDLIKGEKRVKNV